MTRNDALVAVVSGIGVCLALINTLGASTFFTGLAIVGVAVVILGAVAAVVESRKNGP